MADEARTVKGFKELLAEAMSRIVEISPTDAVVLHGGSRGALFLDVREPEEYRAGHVLNALLVPRGVLEPKAAADSPIREPLLVDQSQLIVTYCASGARSAFAVDVLQVLGFTDVRSLAGGYAAWKRDGHPIGT